MSVLSSNPEQTVQLLPFTTVCGSAPYLRQTNIDTDVIIRIDRLTGLAKDQLGRHALEALRYRPDGTEDPDCVLNRPIFRGAPILIAGSNFGCGSSREAAVWALQGIGIRCVIAPDFGDIFFSNCFQNGVLPISLSAAEVDTIGAACEQGEFLKVDLYRQMLVLPRGQIIPFAVDPMRREGLLNGLDDIGLTLQHSKRILRWQQTDRLHRPWVWNAGTQEPPSDGAIPITP